MPVGDGHSFMVMVMVVVMMMMMMTMINVVMMMMTEMQKAADMADISVLFLPRWC